MRSFCRGGNLKALLDREDSPAVLSDLKPALKLHFGSEFHGTLLADILAFGNVDGSSDDVDFGINDMASLDDDKYRLLLERINALPNSKFHAGSAPSCEELLALEPRAYFRTRVDFKGVTFAKSSTSKSDCFIAFRGQFDKIFVGEIAEIFSHRRPSGASSVTETFLLVRPFQELSGRDAIHDPFRKFPLLNIRLCYQEFSDSVVIAVTDIISHIALCPFSSTEIHCALWITVSMDRVSQGISYDVLLQTILPGRSCFALGEALQQGRVNDIYEPLACRKHYRLKFVADLCAANCCTEFISNLLYPRQVRY
jgi:hypothetical protein